MRWIQYQATGTSKIAEVRDDALIREEDRPDDRYQRQPGHGDRRQQRGRPGLREPLAQDTRQAHAEERQGQAADDLVGLEVDGHDAMQEAQQAARDHARQQPEPRVAGGDHGREADHGADQHHALDAQVQDAGSLGEDLADRREEQHGARRHARRDDDDGVHGQTPIRRTKRTR